MNGIRGREYSEVSGVLDGSRATVDRCCRPDPPSVSLTSCCCCCCCACGPARHKWTDAGLGWDMGVERGIDSQVLEQEGCCHASKQPTNLANCGLSPPTPPTTQNGIWPSNTPPLPAGMGSKQHPASPPPNLKKFSQILGIIITCYFPHIYPCQGC